MLKFFVVLLVVLAQTVVYATGTSTLAGTSTWTVDMPSAISAIQYLRCPKHSVEMKKCEYVQVQGKYWIWGWICPLCEIEEDIVIEIKTLDNPLHLPEK